MQLATLIAAILAMLANGDQTIEPKYSPPSPPPGSTCYRLALSQWVPAVKPKEIAWIMPPTVIALSPLPVEDNSPAAGRVLPDVDPAIPGGQMKFAEWRKKDADIELIWTNGFAGMIMNLAPERNGLRGSGRTVSDVIGEAPHHFTVKAKRVDCRHVERPKGAAQR